MMMCGAEHPESPRVRRRVVYHGRVQGVFFRATARDLARGFRVTGFVRNLPDGTVELEVQGSADEVERFLSRVRARYREHIRHTDESTLPPRDDEVAFDIRY